MTKISELSQACKLHQRLLDREEHTEQLERDCRALWLRATAKGATRTAIMESCGITQSFLEGELRKARAETDDPELAKTRTAKGGLTLGEYWCEGYPGCPRAKGNGNIPLQSAQALGMHKVASHGFKLGANVLTAEVVKIARKSKKSTRDLAKEYGVSPHALGAARKGRTWKSI